MARHRESANHDEKGEHRYLHDSLLATSPLYNSSSQMIDPTGEFSLVPVEFSSTPISSQKKLQHQKTNHLSRLRQAGFFDEESPTSVLELNASTLWQQHLNRLLDESSGDMGKIVLVPDNARSLPPSYQSTPKRANRPLLSKSLALSASNKYRPCRWNSEVPSSVPTSSGASEPTKKPLSAILSSSSSSSLSSSSSSSLSASSRLPPPPFLGTSPGVASYPPRPTSVLASDTQPVLPTRSSLDGSDHCELPSITRARRNRRRRLRRHTSDSVLARPERKDSESGEDTSEEFGLMERL